MRASSGVGLLWYCKDASSSPAREYGFAPIVITAAISVAALLAVVGWEIRRVAHEKQSVSSFVATYAGESTSQEDAPSFGSETEATSTDVVSLIGPAVINQLLETYVGMQEDGSYTAQDAQKAAEDFASALKAPVEYLAYQTSDIRTDPDTSYARMLAYRSDLRESLAPLLDNTRPEYEVFALYVQTKDAAYLTQLDDIAKRYHDAQSATASVIAPRDAVPYHVAILNAMGKFAATLHSMSAHADDPFATVALLRSYNEAETDILASFNALTAYYKSKSP